MIKNDILTDEINREYLEVLDKTVKLIPLTFDVMFKGVFGSNLELLKRFIISELKLDIDCNDCSIHIANTELLKENYKEYKMSVDVNVLLNNNILIDIEINRRPFNSVKKRNFMYVNKEYSTLLESGKTSDDLDNMFFYQLNLNAMDKKEKYGEHVIVPYDKTISEVYIDNEVVVLKYLEYYRRLYYNGVDELGEDALWLVALTSKSFVELYDVLSKFLNNSLVILFMKDVIRMNLNDFNLHAWEKEKLDAYVEKKEKERLEEEKKKAILKSKKKG